MEVYNSGKNVDIGLGLLTNPNKKKKKKYFDVKKPEIENTNLKDTQEINEDKDLLVKELNIFFNTDNKLITEYDILMKNLINMQLNLIKHKNYIKKIENHDYFKKSSG